MEQEQQDQIELENFREQLVEQHRQQFLESLKNDDDPSAERYALIGIVSEAMQRLLNLERKFVDGIISDKDGICPGCLRSAVVDVERLDSVAIAFNHYLDNDECSN